MNETKTILFACRQNAGRSQMAAAIARKLAPESVEILSAGTEPASEIHSEVVVALAEIGLEPFAPNPRVLESEDVKRSDWVVTMGCGEACPVFPGKHYLDWEVGDPAGKTLEEVRAIRDDIEDRVRQLLADLG